MKNRRYLSRNIFAFHCVVFSFVGLIVTSLSANTEQATDQPNKLIVRFDISDFHPEILYFDNLEFQGEPVFKLSSIGLYKGVEQVCTWSDSMGQPMDEILMNSQPSDEHYNDCDERHLFDSGYLPCGGMAYFQIYFDEQITENRFSKIVENERIYFEVISSMDKFGVYPIDDYADYVADCP